MMITQHSLRWSIILFLSMVFAQNAHSSTYWVAPSGSPSSKCSSLDNACQSIDQALKLAKEPGDVVNIAAGTYTQSTADCSFFQHPVLACIRASGTKEQPIVIQAAPGNEGQVVIDGGDTFAGIMVRDYDYITIRNLEFANLANAAIYSQGVRHTSISKDDNSGLSVGVVVENNYIHDISATTAGGNIGAIRLDSGKNWTIKNNKMMNICGTSSEGCKWINSACVYSYVVINARVENNYCSNSGAFIHWKDSVVDENNNPTIHGSTVKYNFSENTAHGFYVSHGDANPESSNHTVTNNIFTDLVGACLALFTDTADGAQSVNYIYEHNICDRADVNVYSKSAEVLSAKGNIFSHPKNSWSHSYRYFNSPDATLVAADHNIYAPQFSKAEMQYDTGGLGFTTLAAWQTASVSSKRIPASPDQNSAEFNTTDIYTDENNGLFTPPINSPLLGFMPNGDNAGPYQKGNETIGLINNYLQQPQIQKSPPNPPRLISVEL